MIGIVLGLAGVVLITLGIAYAPWALAVICAIGIGLYAYAGWWLHTWSERH